MAEQPTNALCLVAMIDYERMTVLGESGADGADPKLLRYKLVVLIESDTISISELVLPSQHPKFLGVPLSPLLAPFCG